MRRIHLIRGRRVAVLCLAAAALLAGAIVLLDRGEQASAPAGPPGFAASPAGTGGGEEVGRKSRRLSDERTVSRWANVRSHTTAHRRPDDRSRIVAEIRTETPDRTPEVVLALAERRSPDGERWVKARLPVRPNNTTGWVPRTALGRYQRITTAMTINNDRLRATLYDRGTPIWRAPIAVGTPSNPTPGGRFYVRSRIVPTEPDGLYGVFAFGISGFSPGLSDWPSGGMVGIHGTDRPELIPGRVSHGCVRVRNRAIQRLRHLMPLGTPVRIR